MPDIPLLKKLGIKSGMKISFINVPEEVLSILGELPPDADVEELNGGGLKDFIHGFYKSDAGLRQDARYLKLRIRKDGMIWISWPKGTSGLATDLNREKVRSTMLEEGLVDVKVCAVDETWSGLKFVYRIKNRNSR